MDYTVEHITHLGTRKLRQPQMVFTRVRYSSEWFLRPRVKKALESKGMMEVEQWVFHPTTGPFEDKIRVVVRDPQMLVYMNLAQGLLNFG
jgi:hypothetical protein